LFGDLTAGGLGFEVGGIVARMGKRAAVEFDDACGDDIEKLAGVCDKNNRAG